MHFLFRTNAYKQTSTYYGKWVDTYSQKRTKRGIAAVIPIKLLCFVLQRGSSDDWLSGIAAGASKMRMLQIEALDYELDGGLMGPLPRVAAKAFECDHVSIRHYM